jgi:hypothetical protein
MPAPPDTITNGLVTIVVQSTATGIRETYSGKKGAGWRILLESGSALRKEPELKCNDTVVSSGFVEAARSA